MFMNLQKSRVFYPQREKDFTKYPDIHAALAACKESPYIYFMWNGRVYDIQGYDIGMREEHLL